MCTPAIDISEILDSHEAVLLIWYYCDINMSGWCWKDIDLSLSWHELSRRELGWHLEMDWSLFLRDQRPMTTSLNYLVSSLSPAPCSLQYWSWRWALASSNQSLGLSFNSQSETGIMSRVLPRYWYYDLSSINRKPIFIHDTNLLRSNKQKFRNKIKFCPPHTLKH